MSHLQGVVFIAVLCAVNAAVTVNVYEDDVETLGTNKAHEVESCNTEACNQICRLLGFKSGICVGDTCECRKSLKDDDQLKHNDVHSLDEGVSGTELGGCNPLACYQLCRRLKFPSGTCVNGRCKCDNFRQDPDQLEQNNILSLDEGISRKELGGCDPNACYQLCRRLKFPSGTCVNGRCKCDNFRQDPEKPITEAMDNGVSDQVHGGCTNAACSTLCHILGYRYGVCINSNTCKCSNALRTDDLEISLDQGINEYIDNAVEPNVDTVVPNEVRDCDQRACTMGCLELGAPGGSCSLGKCRCNKRGKPITEAMDNGVSDQVHGGCTNAACSTLCHILGYRYGVCINSNTCKCSNALRTDDLEISLDQEINEYIANAVEPNVDTVVPNEVRDCDQRACTMGCLELGAPGGSCSLGKCRCNKRDKENENLRSWQIKTCNNVNCYFMCRRWGYIGGSCHGNSCLCV